MTSHAAVVARGMGKPCVCGVESLQIDPAARSFTVDGTTISRATRSRSTAAAGS